MHPLLRSGRTYGAYLIAWIPLELVYAYLFAAGGRISFKESFAVTIPVVFVLSLFCLVPYYSCRALPLGSRSTARIVVSHTVPAMFFSGLTLFVSHIVIKILESFYPQLDLRFRPLFPVLAVMVLLTYLLSTALHYVFQAVERSQQAEILSREAQLRALKAQVNPHFLFNSLNSISALTALNPARARDMCIRLSDFLRTSLRLGERTTIRFAEELELAQTYLDVERVRFGDRLVVAQNVEEACAQCDVPPLVIQPLIENAMKHGVATLPAGGTILLVAKVEDGKMQVTIENDFDPDAPAVSKSGFGIANVRSRLEARYGLSATLNVQVIGNRYRVVLSIPVQTPRESAVSPRATPLEAKEITR